MAESFGEELQYEGGGVRWGDHAFSRTPAELMCPPLRMENPGRQISSVNLNPILRTESPGQKAVGLGNRTTSIAARMLEGVTRCFGLGEPLHKGSFGILSFRFGSQQDVFIGIGVSCTIAGSL